MELACLHCVKSFDVDEARLDPEGGTVRCPSCGIESFVLRQVSRTHLRAVTDAMAAAAAPPRPPSTSRFIKPMRAFAGTKTGQFTRGPSEPEVITDKTKVPTESTTGRTQVPAGEKSTTGRTRVSQTPPRVETPAADGPWLVKSPTGLILEFPATQTVLTWSAVIENPAPYLISRDAAEWVGLDAFLSECRISGRGLDGFKRAAAAASGARSDIAPIDQAGAASGTESRQVKPVNNPQTTAVKTGSQPAVPPRSSPTSQFQFKLKQNPPPAPAWRKWVFIGVGAVLVAAGVAVGLFFAGVFD